MSKEEVVPDLYRLAFIPGCFRCPKCEFQLSRTCINANTGEMGTREQDRESEPCPNDGTMLVHVTYQERVEEYHQRLKEKFAIKRELLEALRKLANEASGFLALSDIQRHGMTNTRILRDRIEEARDIVRKVEGAQ